MMKIDANAALGLAALVRSDLGAIARIESHVSQFDLTNLSPAELDSLGYSMHNIYNALENCFTQISLSFENHVRDHTRWHRELLDKMFLDIKSLRPPYCQKRCAQYLEICLAFVIGFDMHTSSNLTRPKQ